MLNKELAKLNNEELCVIILELDDRKEEFMTEPNVVRSAEFLLGAINALNNLKLDIKKELKSRGE